MRIGVVGGGVAGLGCAYFLSQHGHQVAVFEQAPVLGGLAGCFDFDGLPVEKYYHFVCRDDVDLIDMLARLIDALPRAGVELHTAVTVDAITVGPNGVTGLTVGSRHQPFEAVVSTAPLPILARLLPSDAADRIGEFRSIDYISVVCLI